MVCNFVVSAGCVTTLLIGKIQIALFAGYTSKSLE
jgi:hypothetical protein